MRAVGLGALLLGTLSFLYPTFKSLVPHIHITNEDAQIMGGLLVAVGALTLAVFRPRK